MLSNDIISALDKIVDAERSHMDDPDYRTDCIQQLKKTALLHTTLFSIVRSKLDDAEHRIHALEARLAELEDSAEAKKEEGQ